MSIEIILIVHKEEMPFVLEAGHMQFYKHNYRIYFLLFKQKWPIEHFCISQKQQKKNTFFLLLFNSIPFIRCIDLSPIAIWAKSNNKQRNHIQQIMERKSVHFIFIP